ncbi:MAG: hypothetical protein JXQ96_08200 [Cyclobacteriaceae bacterium]
MKLFTNSKLSQGLSKLLSRRKIQHFKDREQFNSYTESASYLDHFNEAQVLEISYGLNTRRNSF